MLPTQPLNRLREFGLPTDPPQVSDGGRCIVVEIVHPACGCPGTAALRLTWVETVKTCPGGARYVEKVAMPAWDVYVQHRRNGPCS